MLLYESDGYWEDIKCLCHSRVISFRFETNQQLQKRRLNWGVLLLNKQFYFWNNVSWLCTTRLMIHKASQVLKGAVSWFAAYENRSWLINAFFRITAQHILKSRLLGFVLNSSLLWLWHSAFMIDEAASSWPLGYVILNGEKNQDDPV